MRIHTRKNTEEAVNKLFQVKFKVWKYTFSDKLSVFFLCKHFPNFISWVSNDARNENLTNLTNRMCVGEPNQESTLRIENFIDFLKCNTIGYAIIEWITIMLIENARSNSKKEFIYLKALLSSELLALAKTTLASCLGWRSRVRFVQFKVWIDNQFLFIPRIGKSRKSKCERRKGQILILTEAFFLWLIWKEFVNGSNLFW